MGGPSPIAKRLENKVALITGGACDIGKSSARLFAQHGAKVVVADYEENRQNFVCCGLDSNEAISFVSCKLASESDVQKVVDDIISKYNKLDILFSVNNSGINGNVNPNILVADTEDQFKKVLNENVLSAFLAAKHVSKVMISQKGGSIIFTSSIASVTAGEVPLAYAASKHALVGLTKNMCVDLGPNRVRVNCISPFLVPNLMARLANSKEAEKEIISGSANLKEVVMEAEEDAAKAALFLASDDSKYVSGLNLVVDGGYSTSNAILKENLKKRSSM